MTLTEAPPGQAGASRRPPPPPHRAPCSPPPTTRRSAVSTSASSLLFLLVAGVVGLLLRVELAEQGVKVVGDDFGRLFSLHSTVAPLLFLGPFWTGLATVLVPLQIGAPRARLPPPAGHRASGSTSSAGSWCSSPTSSDTPHGAGLALSTPFSGQGNAATDLWIMGLAAGGRGLGAGRRRAAHDDRASCARPGMTLLRAAAVHVERLRHQRASCCSPRRCSSPACCSSYLDQHFGGAFFAAATAGSAEVVWQHMLWLYGRPEVYLLALPGLGAACDIVVTAAASVRFPAGPGRPRRVALAAVGFLSLSAWAAGTEVARRRRPAQRTRVHRRW